MPEQPDTYIEVEVGSEWTIPDAMNYTKSRWTPFAGMKVYGSVKRVYLRGQIAMVDGKVRQLYIRKGPSTIKGIKSRDHFATFSFYSS